MKYWIDCNVICIGFVWKCNKPNKGQNEKSKGSTDQCKKVGQLRRARRKVHCSKWLSKEDQKVSKSRTEREVHQLMQQTKQRAKWEEQEVRRLTQQTKRVGQLRRARKEVHCSKQGSNKEDEKVSWSRRAREVCQLMQQTKKGPIEKSKRCADQCNKQKRPANWEKQEESSAAWRSNQTKKKKGQPIEKGKRSPPINARNQKRANQEEQVVCKSMQQIKKGQMIKKSKKRGLLLKAAIKQRRWKVGQLRRAREVCQLMQQTKQRAKWEDQEVHGLMQQTKKVGQLRRARREACCSKNKEDDERLADQEQKERSNDQCNKPKEWPIEKSKRPTDWCNKQKSSANQEEQEERSTAQRSNWIPCSGVLLGCVRPSHHIWYQLGSRLCLWQKDISLALNFSCSAKRVLAVHCSRCTGCSSLWWHDRHNWSLLSR